MSVEDPVASPQDAALREERLLDSREAGGKVIRGGAMRAAGYVLGIVVGLVSTPFMVRHLGPADFGHFLTVSALIFIVAGVSEAGVTNVAIREFAVRDPVGRRKLMREVLGLRLALSLAGVITAVVFALGAGYERVLVYGTLAVGAGAFVGSFQHALTVPLSVQLRLGWIAGLDLFRQVATAALIVVLVLVGASLFPFYLVVLATAALTLVLTVVPARDYVSILPSMQPRRWWPLLRETLPYAAATALGIVYFQIAIITMSLIATEAETGYFGVSFRIIDIANGIPWLLVGSAFPILARAAYGDRERLSYALQRMFEVVTVTGLWFSICVVCGAGFAIEVVGGDEFEPAVEVLQLLGIGIPFTFLIATWSFALLSLKMYRTLMWANALAIVFALAANQILIPAEGALGAGISVAATEVVLAAAYGVALMRGGPDLRVSLRLLPRVALAAALGFAVGLLLPVHDVIAVSAATAVYGLLLVAMRAIPQEVWDALRRRAPEPAGGAGS